jgi:tight adherence protein B
LLAHSGSGRTKARLAARFARRRKTDKDAATGRRPSASLAELYRATEDRFAGQRLWTSIEGLLERADLPLRTAEFVWLSAACGLSAGLLGVLFGVHPLVALGLFAAGALAPFGFVAHKARKRVRAFETQLPDLLITLAASLRAGHSLRQAIQTVVKDGEQPAKKEFGRVVAETSLGRPLEEGLADMAKRLQSSDFDYVVTAITIQREVGGALANLFDMVADTVRARQQFRRKLRSLTAMGRLSALILIGLPFFVGFALTAINADYVRPLWHTSAGQTLMGLGIAMMVIGSLFLRKIVSFRG